jgi:hypothetical protein
VLEINHTWTHTGSSGGLTPVVLDFPCIESVLMVQHSTLATTNSFSFQTAQTADGPWFTEASTSISTTADGQVALRVTGPFTAMRPYFHTASTGTYTVRLIGVS